LALSNLFFIITAIQYWASAYEKQVLGVTDENKIFISFTVVCITSPTLGLFFGGMVSAKTGGYEAKHSILVCFIFGLLAGIAAIPVPITNDIFYFTLYLWLVLFFGGAILPNLIGIIITSLPHHLRGSANSMTNLITNLFGYLPAPALYGLIFEKYKETNDRFAMQVIIYSSFIGSFFLVIAMYLRYVQKAKEELINVNNVSGNSLKERKTSMLSANSNLTINLDKLYNPNSVINVNHYENSCVKEQQREEGTSSSNSDNSLEFNANYAEEEQKQDKKQLQQQGSENSSSNRSRSKSSDNSNNSNYKKKNKNAKNQLNLSSSVMDLGGAKSDNEFANYLSGGAANNNFKSNVNHKNHNVNNVNNIDKKKKQQLIKLNNQTKKSFDDTQVKEDSEVNNISLDSRNNNSNKKFKSGSCNNNRENTAFGVSATNKASANPNFNYNKYLEENVFNVTAENENQDSCLKLISDKESKRNYNAESNKHGKLIIPKAEADSNIINTGVLHAKNIYGKHYSYLNNDINNSDNNGNSNSNSNNHNSNLSSTYLNPLSIKTPNFNFVGNSSDNFFLDEKEGLSNFPNLGLGGGVVKSSDNYNGDDLEQGSEFALNGNSDNNSKVNKNEILNKQYHNTSKTRNNAYESSEDNRMKFSYESADNNKSEYSLFNPIKYNLSALGSKKNLEEHHNITIHIGNDNDNDDNSDLNSNVNSYKVSGEKLLELNSGKNQNASLIVGKVKDETEKLEIFDDTEILISEHSVDEDHLKYNQEASNSFKKFDDYI